MKLVLILTFLAHVSVAHIGSAIMDIKAFQVDSKAGKKLVSSARALEDNFDDAMVATHSIVFQACHTSISWTDDGYAQVSLVSFVLCPSDSCSDGTCSSEYYGEYLVDIITFVDAYMEYKLEALAYKCETMRESCGCDDDSASCLYYCYKDYDNDEWELCLGLDGDGEEQLGECQRFEIPEADDDANNQQDEEEEERELFMGPTCGASGNGIFLTLFADEECTVAVEGANSVYYQAMGKSMPYREDDGGTGIVDNECISCKEIDEDGNDDDAADEDNVSRMCEEIYEASTKCETNMVYNYYKNEAGCNYLESVKADSSASYNSVLSSNSWAYIATMFVGLTVAAVAAVHFVRKRRGKFESSRATPLVESEMTQQN